MKAGFVKIGVYLLAAVLLFGLLFPAGGLEARTASSTTIQVRAVVLPWVKLNLINKPQSIVVTAEDVQRGYLDSVVPFFVEVSSNGTGCLLAASVAEGPVRDVQLSLSMSGASFGPPGIVIPVRKRENSLVAITYRLLLKSDATAGEYPWPMLLSVSPL